ncbi:hypothetical protein G7046_g7806 [Stylonectria norvegica]|nr:hypothetical protein G7046_g7806 [Stylonectria norvegica]
MNLAAAAEADDNQMPLEVISNRLPDHEVTWDGPDDPENPYNWSSRRKITIAVVYSCSSLVTTMSASMIAPALDQVLKDLNMGSSAGQIAFSVFFLGLGLAPFIVAPLSETFGRKPVWLAGNAFYVIWNSLCPVGFSPALMIIGRLLSAAGASVGVTLTSSAVADVYRNKDRGQSLAIAGILPYIGPALGPIVGGLAAQHLWWPWLFWILSIFDVAFIVLGIFAVQETYTPTLLRRKARLIALRSGGNSIVPSAKGFRASSREIHARIRPQILKPVQLLTQRPIIGILALAMAIGFGIYTLVISTFASLWTTNYGQSKTASSLHYIAIALGAITSAQAGGRLMDFMWRRTCAARPQSEPTPEYRLPYVIIGLIPAVAGLFWYGWAAERGSHWAVVDFGVFFFTVGTFMFSQGLLAYMVDEFSSTRAASASAATRFGTYLFGFIFPIFAPQLYNTLGYGWGNSLLGLLYLAFTAPIILAIWIWGPRLRSIGRTAEDEKERIH